jgi:hypothetical protein
VIIETHFVLGDEDKKAQQEKLDKELEEYSKQRATEEKKE